MKKKWLVKLNIRKEVKLEAEEYRLKEKRAKTEFNFDKK